MWLRRIQNSFGLRQITGETAANLIGRDNKQLLCCAYSSTLICVGLPRKLTKHDRKPMVTSVNELKREAQLVKKQRQTVQEIPLKAPDNGLLVKELVPVAHEVYNSRTELFACVSRVAQSIPIYTCSLCGEVHIGHPPHLIRTCTAGALSNKEHSWKRGGIENILPVIESFHLYDWVGRAVSHNERLQVDRIPAIVELCVQAGVDIAEYPTRRRKFPVYNVAGRIVDYEHRFPKDDLRGQGISTYGFWGRKQPSRANLPDFEPDDIQGVALRGLEAWENMCSGAARLMGKYCVQTCGYCSEVQVGSKGHRVRNCYARRHQMRDGQHAWQKATVGDIVPPVYVWHVRDGHGGEALVNSLKRYYGMLPAVVELFAQAGAQIGEKYAGVMREDVVVPDLEEERLVV